MKIVIVGAGYAGLATGALLANTGHKVHIYEAHTYIGGCASFFKRRHFKFDAGATTLSGLGTNRPLHRLIELLGIELPITKLERPMKITLNNGQSFIRHADLKTHIETMNTQFPGHDHHKFWHQLKAREEDLWSILSVGQYFPPKSFKDLRKLITPDLLKRTPLGLWAFTPFIRTIPKSMQADKALMDFINEQLLISTQGHADQVPALLAAMGLIYPDDMYYTPGGMVSLADKLSQFIKEKGGEVLLRRPITQISKNNSDRFKILIKGPADKVIEDEADLVISNLTVWDTPKVLDNNLKKNYPEHKTRGAWGAITAYFAIKTQAAIKPLYHQVHYHEEWLEKGSFFFSLSDPEDGQRAPEGWQTVTVSTHTDAIEWHNKSKQEYANFKGKFKELILNKFEQVVSSKDVLEMTDPEIGTPLTFERFTRRHRGLVGGLPHSLRNNILTFPSQETPIDGLFQIGDTTFPGQGVVGVVTGALMLAGKINNTNYLK